LHVLSNTGINIISLTFDGCSTNITAAKLLGCNFTIDALNTSFASEYDDSKIVTIFDLAHMVKLVRNAFGEKKIFLDYKIMKLILNMSNAYAIYRRRKGVI